MIIYKITNTINGKLYIGKTIKDLDFRWQEHLKHAKRGKLKYALYNAIRKYGEENFTVEKIFSCSKEHLLLKMEIHFIKRFKSLTTQNGYNMKDGGQSGTPDANTRYKISKAMKGHPVFKTKEFKEMSKRNYEMNLKNNPSFGFKNRKHTDEWKKDASERRKNFKYTDESKRKMSESQIAIARKGKDNPRSKRIDLISKTGKKIRTFVSMRDAATKLGIIETSISAVCRGVNKHAKGKFFRYSVE